MKRWERQRSLGTTWRHPRPSGCGPIEARAIFKELKKAGWVRPDPDSPLSDDPAVLQTQVKELRRQVKRLEMEKDILKKATAYFASQNLSASTLSISDERSLA